MCRRTASIRSRPRRMTSTWRSPAHMNAQITASGKKNPTALPALMPAIFTFGATPTMPTPFDAAAIVPAVCVPWPLSSFAAAAPGTGAPLRQFALSASDTFGARSGWWKSRPVSMSPTSTDGLPPVIACACGVWIWRMSHCIDEKGSESAAGALGRVPCAPLASSLPSLDAKPAVEDTPSIRLSFARSFANDALSDRAIATPIWSYPYTNVPPAFWTSVFADAGTALPL